MFANERFLHLEFNLVSPCTTYTGTTKTISVQIDWFKNVVHSSMQEALKRKLKARMEYAKFLQDTAKEMAKEVQTSRSGEMKQTAEDLDEFLNKVSGSYMFCLLPQVEYIDH